MGFDEISIEDAHRHNDLSLFEHFKKSKVFDYFKYSVKIQNGSSLVALFFLFQSCFLSGSRDKVTPGPRPHLLCLLELQKDQRKNGSGLITLKAVF